MDLAAAVAELYGLPPEDFTSTRNDRARAARGQGDRDLAEQVRRLRKPSTAAWVVNALVRHQPDQVDQVLGLGAALREAQETLDGEELRELNRQRHALVAAVTRQARALAERLGHPVSEGIAVEVEQTLRAGMADEQAAAAVRSGQLTAALSSTGFAPVDLAGAVAVPSLVPPVAARPPSRPPRTEKASPRGRGRDRRAERALQEARQKAQDAERAAAQAEERRGRAAGRVREAGERQGEVEAELADLERRVRALEADAAQAERDVRAAERERDQAERAADSAARAAERARGRVERMARP